MVSFACPHRIARSSHRAQRHARRILWPKEHVRIVLPVVAEISNVHPLFRGQRLESRAIQLHRENMHLPRIIFIRREEHRPRSLVHALNSQHLEVALGQLPLQLRIRGHRILLVKAVQIEMHVAVAPARPQKLSRRLQEPNLDVIEVNPRPGRSLGQHNPRFARFRIHEIQVHLVLGAVQHLRPDHSFAHPAKPRDVRLLIRWSAKSTAPCPSPHPPLRASPPDSDRPPWDTSRSPRWDASAASR